MNWRTISVRLALWCGPQFPLPLGRGISDCTFRVFCGRFDVPVLATINCTIFRTLHQFVLWTFPSPLLSFVGKHRFFLLYRPCYQRIPHEHFIWFPGCLPFFLLSDCQLVSVTTTVSCLVKFLRGLFMIWGLEESCLITAQPNTPFGWSGLMFLPPLFFCCGPSSLFALLSWYNIITYCSSDYSWITYRCLTFLIVCSIEGLRLAGCRLFLLLDSHSSLRSCVCATLKYYVSYSLTRQFRSRIPILSKCRLQPW